MTRSFATPAGDHAEVTRDSTDQVVHDLDKKIRRLLERASEIGGLRYAADDHAHIDDVIDSHLRRISDRLASKRDMTNADWVEYARISLELVQLINRRHRQVFAGHLRDLSAVHLGWQSPSLPVDRQDLFHKIARDACRGCGLDRALIFTLTGTTLAVQAAYMRGNEAWAASAHAFARDHPISVNSNRFEGQVLQRRSAGLVLDPGSDPTANHPIVANTRSFSYVSAPILCSGKAIGTVNADMYFSGRNVDEVDRDSLATYAASVGLLLERALLIDRLVSQRERALALLQESDDLIVDLRGGQQPLVSAAGGPTSGGDGQKTLTDREQDVLRLMAAGATNYQIARHLHLAEGTVKVHAKRIFRKLDASNRAEAVSKFLNIYKR